MVRIQDGTDDTHIPAISVSSEVARDTDVNDSGMPVGLVNGWGLHKLQHVANNQARSQGELEIVSRPP